MLCLVQNKTYPIQIQDGVGVLNEEELALLKLFIPNLKILS
jgi:hypothetical protein